MISPWVIEEMMDLELLDQRLNLRLARVLDCLAARPNAGIPEACGGYAETAATYRLFDNNKVSFDKILEPHRLAARRRLQDHDVVLLVQDTTEIDLSRPTQVVAGAGPLDDGARVGVLLHPLIAFTRDGTPLGTVDAHVWTREDPPSPRGRRDADRKHTPIEDKESQRWVSMLRSAGEEARLTPDTQFIALADSEADIFELFVETAQLPDNADWIVRACQNRALVDPDHPEAGKLREQVLSAAVRSTAVVPVRGREAKVDCETRGRRQSRESRTAEVEIRATTVTLRNPWRHDRKLPDVAVNVVLVSEPQPPTGEPAIEWLLLTSLPVTTLPQVERVIQSYCVRWLIEVFFRTLKTGCRIEDRRFETLDRVLNSVATYLIVTWRTLFVCHLGREFPDISCEAVFSASEWKPIFHIVCQSPPPNDPPSLRAMVELVARLGGYLNRSRDGVPGPQTIWLGLQRLHDIAQCWETFGPDSRTNEPLLV